MTQRIDDLRVRGVRPLLAPAIIQEELPLTPKAAQTVQKARGAVVDILHGRDDRLLVVAGPCSIHDPQAGIDYAGRLLETQQRYRDQLVVLMRTYFEKPRTTVGWKGLINDPGLDNSFRINDGLRAARRILRDLADMGMPAGTEFLDPISPQFYADLVSWGAIGARTTESQVHRELASGLSMPVGFKNGTRGTVQIAVDAVRSASHPHRFLGVTKQGITAIVATDGNPDCHVIHRGGREPNFSEAEVGKTVALLETASLAPSLMVDFSHANSGKDPNKQPEVANEIARQISGGSRAVFGVMLESFLEEGRQDVEEGKELVYGKSITDACMSWTQTEPVFEVLANAVEQRRG